jgi:cell division protein FtsI (penicillin-binding protein 3)
MSNPQVKKNTPNLRNGASRRKNKRQSLSSKTEASKRQVKPQREPKVKTKINDYEPPKARLIMVWGVLVFGILALGWNLYRLQVLDASELMEKARSQQMTYLRPYLPRRSIIDNQNNVLATDRLVYSLFVHPIQFKISKQEMANMLSPILGDKTPEELLKSFNLRDTGIRIAYALPETTADQIAKLSLDGIELIQQYTRFYPQQDAIADILGYVNQEHEGQAGIELSQQKLLEREIMTLHLSRSGNGALMPTYMDEGLLNKDDLRLQLTIDLRLQRAVRTALKSQMEAYSAKRGTVIVMDVRDGSILSLVCEPTYDANKYYEVKDFSIFKNWAVTDLYEPGSTFKPINIAIALDQGVIKPDTSIYDSGIIYIDTWPIKNHDFASRGANGNLTIAEVLQRSSNVAMIQIMQRVNRQKYYDELKRLGLGQKIGIDLPGENASHLKDEKLFTSTKIEAATSAFGQGFSLTPVKLAQLHAAISNGGKLIKPHLIKGLVDPQGQFHWQPNLEQKQVFTPATSKIVTEMMETVVTQGSGSPAKIPGYRIGGKTGTAQKAGKNGGYLPDAKITSFVSILPIDNPRYVVLAVIDEPQGANTFGSTVAAPIVKSVMDALISLYAIPPSSQPTAEPSSENPPQGGHFHD